MEANFAVQYDLFGKLRKAEANYRKSPKERLKPSYIETRLENLEELWKDFKSGHKIIVATISEADKAKAKYFGDDLYDQFEEMYTLYKCLLKDFSCKISGAQPSASPSPKGIASDVKLPRIQLPSFSGKYEEWQTFYDMHTSIIHKNTALSNVEKFHYLKTSLTGDAAVYLRNYSTTEQNYLEAWNQLIKRYNNKKYNCNTVIKTLLSQKRMSHESSSAIRHLIDTTSSCLTSLKNMAISVDNWDPLVVYFVVTRLDTETHKLWENYDSQVNQDELATWQQLVTFLESRFRSQEMVESARHMIKPLQQNVRSTISKPKVFHSSSMKGEASNHPLCILCEGQHFIYNCKTFLQHSVDERQNIIQSKRLCFNCLSSAHSVKGCRHSTCCKKCGRRHHSLLHRERDNHHSTSNEHSENQANKVSTSSKTTENKVSAHFMKDNSASSSTETRISAHMSSKTEYNVLLATAIVKTCSKNGVRQIVRALIDQGSQASFISERAVQLLGLPRIPINGLVSGLGDGKIRSKYMTSLRIESHHNPTIIIQVNAYVLGSLTSFIPSRHLHPPEWSELRGLTLADPGYCNPARIDILLGAEVYSEILMKGVLKNFQGLVAQETTLGWIISGKLPHDSINTHPRITSLHVQDREYDLLKQFFEIEAEPDSIQKRLTPSEQICENFYKATTTRNLEGRFVVKLPFKSEDPLCQYGNSREIALRKLKSQENRLIKDPELYKEYKKVMEEYIALNHMTEVDQSDIDNPKAVYLPHHAVVNKEKETSKVRIVYNASSKGYNGVSLNDDLLAGPKLQQDLRHLIMRWRTHRISIVADLVKMFRQVRVHDEDANNFQRILWRSDPEKKVKHYKLLTLTFGTACAPYLAVKTLQRLAVEEGHRFQKAAEITKHDYYIDDLMTGCEDNDEAMQIYEEMNGLMNAGGFQLQKWNSNSSQFLSQIDAKNKNSNNLMVMLDKSDNKFKVLGLYWNRNSDNFEYVINLPESTQPITKRQILSDIARLYDPIGWIAPVVVKAKMIIQKVWKAGLDWDATIYDELLTVWLEYKRELSSVKDIIIPRWLGTSKNCKMELHAFSDASKAAYAAAVYLRVINQDGSVHVSLITAKTKVSPIGKELSIPRLELCGADLAAKIISEVAQVMNISKGNTYAWTDSTVVLAWLKGASSRWATFVSNRVSNILTVLEYEQWGHVPSELNPADCASRGLSPVELQKHKLWWHGPTWLSNAILSVVQPEIPETEEEKINKSFSIQQHYEEDFEWSKFSSLTKMVRVITRCRRILNWKLPKSERQKVPGYLTSKELQETLQICIKQVQHFEFADDIKHLAKHGCVLKRSVLHNLCPILDEIGVLRVGGRIHQASSSYDKRHPIVIPRKSHLAQLLVSDVHSKTLHGGPQLMLNVLRAKYWIIGARDIVKKHFRNCVTCIRYSKAQRTQLMGQLPDVRLKPGKPFKCSGLDYAGPINIRFSPGRGSKSYKGYICVFVCMVTRAIHLEAVTDLSAKGFIAAFRRFTSRRGHCQDLYSDNATNFVGADKMLQNMLREARKDSPNELMELLTLETTTWHFIPPYAPNFGGLWEAGVRSVKTHLRKVIGDKTLTFEELSTVLTQIEACLNSRPITVLSESNDDPLPLTPGHFLVGEPLINIPDENYVIANISYLERWKMVQRMVSDFWTRWSKEYLVSLSHRYKWTTKLNEPNIGDVVILRDEHLPPSKWVLGKIVTKHPGPDNVTRVVTVKCKNGLYKRALSKVSVLPK